MPKAVGDGSVTPACVAVFRHSPHPHEGCITKAPGIPILTYPKNQIFCIDGDSGSPVVDVSGAWGIHTDTDLTPANHSGLLVTQQLIDFVHANPTPG